jgi:tetratricopeptide (TPR) repeat protein
MLAEQGSSAASVLPDSVQGIIAARLDALPADEKQLLQDAAVLGKVVWQSGLAAIAGGGGWQLEERLHRLARKEFLRRAQRSSIDGDTEYAFRHVLVRDVAYAQIPRAQRADKHARAADWIDSLSSGRDDSVDMRAHHLSQALEYAAAAGHDTAELRDRARSALRQAGERAYRMDAHATAISHFDAALHLTADDHPEVGFLLLGLGQAHLMNADPRPELFERAIERLHPVDPSAAAFAETRLGLVRSRAGDGAAGIAHNRRALELLEQAPDGPYAPRVMMALGVSAVVESRLTEAIRWLDGFLAAADPTAFDPRSILSAHSYRGLARAEVGDLDGLEEARAAIDEMRRDRFFELYIHLTNLATAVLILGDLAEFRALNVEGLEALPPSLRRGMTDLLPEIALADYLTGDWDAALITAGEVDRGVRSGEFDASMASEAMGIQARIAARRGQLAAASVREAAALDAARAESASQTLAPELAESATLRLLAGDDQAARECLGEVLASTADPHVLVSVLPYLGAETTETAELLGLSSTLAAQLVAITQDTPWKLAVQASLAGDHPAAAALYEQIGSLTDAAFAHLRAAETLAESDPAAAAEHHRQATAFYERVGATLHLDRLAPLAERLGVSRG